MKKVIYISLVIGLLFGCKKDKNDQMNKAEYLVFGSFYGECIGENCIEIFKLQDGKLWEDTNDTYPGSTGFYSAAYVQLPDAKYQQVKDLPSLFPAQLLNETNTVIGTPDAGDWGGYYIEYNRNGIHKFWLIDQVGSSSVPAYLNTFTAQVRNKIELIHN